MLGEENRMRVFEGAEDVSKVSVRCQHVVLKGEGSRRLEKGS
jgi:hypothetical protein